NEIETLYVDHFFQNEGIGGKLIDFAVEHFGVDYAWVLEKNHRVMPFYARHGFQYYGTRKPEAGTSEFIIMVERR
ncbi:MAG: GNAT family N-acetyltransferase, partial [Clostridia bacterium]|nr:GNAT family N-acetyltransferase [Clostridia bacterium]